MNGDFGNVEGIVWDSARALGGRVDAANVGPDIGVILRIVELTSGKEAHLAQMHSTPR